MSEAYIGEIRMFAGNFAPVGWVFCDGKTYSIPEYEALYSLIGITYGGDGQTNFAVPDLRGRIPIGIANNYPLGQKGGSETVKLTTDQLPAHSHAAKAYSHEPSTNDPTNAIWAKSANRQYGDPANLNAKLKAGIVSTVGDNVPHNNMMPSLPIGFIIATEGIYPMQR